MSCKMTLGNDELLRSRMRVPGNVVYRAFAQETVVLNLDTGLYHGVNPIGGRMLDVLSKAPSVSDAAGILAQEFEVPREQVCEDLCEFCTALVSRGLLTVESS